VSNRQHHANSHVAQRKRVAAPRENNAVVKKCQRNAGRSRYSAVKMPRVRHVPWRHAHSQEEIAASPDSTAWGVARAGVAPGWQPGLWGCLPGTGLF